MDFASKTIDIDLLRSLDAERTRNLGPWEYEPARRGQITTIFGRYQSGEPAGIAYTCCGDEDQQNIDAHFIVNAANSLGALLDERAEMMKRLAQMRAALDTVGQCIEDFADEGTPADQPLTLAEKMLLQCRTIIWAALNEHGIQSDGKTDLKREADRMRGALDRAHWQAEGRFNGDFAGVNWGAAMGLVVGELRAALFPTHQADDASAPSEALGDGPKQDSGTGAK